MKTAPITATAMDGHAARSALTPQERATCGELELSTRRSDFRAGRLAAKRAGSEAIGGCPLRRLEIRSAEDGAPELTVLDQTGRSRPVPFAISISHRDGRAAAVVGPAELRVGVDLERRNSVSRQTSRYFLTAVERALDVCDPTLLWSLKEAAWKALRLGRGLPFQAVELCHQSDGTLFGVRVEGVLVSVKAHVVQPWLGYQMVTLWAAGGGA